MSKLTSPHQGHSHHSSLSHVFLVGWAQSHEFPPFGSNPKFPKSWAILASELHTISSLHEMMILQPQVAGPGGAM